MPLLSPFEARDMADQYAREFDEGVAKDRAARQVPYAGIDPAQQAYFNAMNDAEQQGATGPAGYNRQWVPLLQALKGKRFVGGGGLPTETYADPDHTGTMSLIPSARDTSTPSVTMPGVTMPTVTMPSAQPTSVGVLKHRAAKTIDPNGMPEDQDTFLARLYAKDPPDWYRPIQPTPTPQPPTTPPTTTTVAKPPTRLPAQPPLGSIAALTRRL
jgi:hypothetical protein